MYPVGVDIGHNVHNVNIVHNGHNDHSPLPPIWSKTVLFGRLPYPAQDQSLSKDKNPRQNLCGFGRFLSQ